MFKIEFLNKLQKNNHKTYNNLLYKTAASDVQSYGILIYKKSKFILRKMIVRFEINKIFEKRGTY